MLDTVCSRRSAFSVHILSLVERIDLFFRRQSEKIKQNNDDEEKGGLRIYCNDFLVGISFVGVDGEGKIDGTIPMKSLRHILVEKFRILWSFQRRRLLDSDTARMALFLNPSNLCRKLENTKGEEEEEEKKEFRWEETAERVRAMISQAYDGQQQEEEYEGAELEIRVIILSLLFC